MAKLTPKEITRVKALGYLFNRDSEDEFNCRVITENGELTSDQLINIAECAKKYGNGNVAFTTRLTVEMKGVKYEHVDAVTEYLAQTGLYTGGTGAKVRPVAACKGSTCVFGQIDTAGIAKKVHDRFYLGYHAVELPHKFKIAVGGCPNNCMKPDLNDIGLVGQKKPVLQADLCRDCKKCIVVDDCPMHACKKENGKVVFDHAICDNCGKCISKCYFKAVSPQEQGVKILIGGKWGRARNIGVALPGIYSIEEAMDRMEDIILVYREHGYKKERFGDMILRLGEDTVLDFILQGNPRSRKEEILEKPIQSRP